MSVRLKFVISKNQYESRDKQFSLQQKFFYIQAPSFSPLQKKPSVGNDPLKQGH